MDFDIIDVTFSNGRVNTVIPVVSNPIDVVPDAIPPIYTQSDKAPAWLSWMKTAIKVALAVAFVIIFWPIIKALFKAIGKLLTWGDKNDKTG